MTSDEPPRTGPGRRLKLLDDDVRESILRAISHGATVENAAQAAGISPSTYHAWIARGRQAAQTREETGDLPDTERPFLEFLEAATRAHARGEVFNAALLRKIAEGGYIVKTRTKRYRDPGTGQLIEETEDDYAPPDLRAVQFYLERRHPAGWGKATQVEVSGPEGGPIPMGVPGGLGALADRIVANMRAIEAGNLDAVDADMVGLTVEEDPDAIPPP